MNQIGHHSAIVLRDDGAQRHTHHEVLTVATVAMVTLTVGAVAGRMVRVPAVRQKGCDRGIGLEDHRTAVTTRATGGFAARATTLTDEAHDAGATVSGSEMYPYPVDEHDRITRSVG
jgi:hypothetical protein